MSTAVNDPLENEPPSIVIGDTVLTTEAVKKLMDLIAKAADAVEKAKESFSVNINNMIKSITVSELLQEDPNDHDKLVIKISFLITIPYEKFKIILEPFTSFSVDCLSENLEEDAKEGFKKTVIDFLIETSERFYTVGDIIRDELDEEEDGQ